MTDFDPNKEQSIGGWRGESIEQRTTRNDDQTELGEPRWWPAKTMWRNHPFPETKNRRRSVVRTTTSRSQKPEPWGDLTGIIRWWEQVGENSPSERLNFDKKKRNREKLSLSLEREEPTFWSFCQISFNFCFILDEAHNIPNLLVKHKICVKKICQKSRV